MKVGIILITIGIINTIKAYKIKNIIIILISLEIILIGISILFINTSINIDDLSGILNSIYLYTLGAAESAIGLSLLIIYSLNYKKS